MIAGYDYPKSYDLEDLLQDIPDTCPVCKGEMDYFENGSNWAAKKCTECGHVESNEPYED